MQCQAVVDRDRKFIDLSVGMLGSTNDARQLRRLMLYHRATTTALFNPAEAVEGFVPYLVGDKGYPILPWLITPYRDLGVADLCRKLYSIESCLGLVVSSKTPLES